MKGPQHRLLLYWPWLWICDRPQQLINCQPVGRSSTFTLLMRDLQAPLSSPSHLFTLIYYNTRSGKLADMSWPVVPVRNDHFHGTKRTPEWVCRLLIKEALTSPNVAQLNKLRQREISAKGTAANWAQSWLFWWFFEWITEPKRAVNVFKLCALSDKRQWRNKLSTWCSEMSEKNNYS